MKGRERERREERREEKERERREKREERKREERREEREKKNLVIIIDFGDIKTILKFMAKTDPLFFDQPFESLFFVFLFFCFFVFCFFVFVLFLFLVLETRNEKRKKGKNKMKERKTSKVR